MPESTKSEPVMSEPIISIILPVYNTAHYLPQCLDSLINQSLQDIQIICIDDGSNDDSLSILEEYASKDQRVMVIQQENTGRSQARNNGLDMATGQYVWFVDSDDYIALNACEKTATLAKQFDADIVTFGGLTFPTANWADWRMTTNNVVYKNKSIHVLFYEMGAYPFAANKIYKRQIIEQHHLRFNPEHSLGEDHHFQFMIFPYTKTVVFCSDIFYFYRQRPSDLELDIFETQKLSADRIVKHFKLVQTIFAEWQERGLVKKNSRQLLEWAIWFLNDDVKQLRYLDRVKFAKEFSKLLTEHNLLDYISKLDHSTKTIASFVLLLEVGDQNAPKVTIIATPGSSLVNTIKGFRTLANQYQQQCQIILLDSQQYPDSSAELQIEAASDERLTIINPDQSTTNAAAATSAASTTNAAAANLALKAAKGDYLLFADLDCNYHPDFLQKLLQENAAYDADIITGREFLGLLRSVSMKRLLVSKSGFVQEGESWNNSFNPADYPELLFTFSSLSAVNKLFKRSFILQQASRGAVIPLAKDDLLGVANALLAAQLICPVQEKLLEAVSSVESDKESTQQAADDSLLGFTRLKEMLLKDNQWQLYQRTYSNALLGFYLYHLDAMADIETKVIWAKALKSALSTLIDFSSYEAGWFYQNSDYQAASQILTTKDLKSYLQNRPALLLQSQNEQFANIDQELEFTQTELKEYLKSKTYQAGVLVTAIPRKLRDILKK